MGTNVDDGQNPAAQELEVRRRGLNAPGKLVAIDMRKAGKSLQDIADALSVDRETVSRFLRDHVSSKEARTLLELQIPQAIEDWSTAMSAGSKRGDHRPARDLLIATDVIQDKQPRGTAVTIHVGNGTHSPGDPLATVLPTITVQAETDDPS